MAYGYTPESCQAACPQFKYFALQNNGWCCCDHDLSHVTKYGKSDCGKAGGGWCNYVFESSPFPVLPAASLAALPYTIIGSFKDTGDRALRWGPHEWGFTA